MIKIRQQAVASVGDPDLMRRSGGEFITAEPAQEYGITDTDSLVIESSRSTRGLPIWRPISEANYLERPLDDHGSTAQGG